MLAPQIIFATSSERVYCFQEQWEIYKLDPVYRCTVYPGGILSSITKVSVEEQNSLVCDASGMKRTRVSSPELSEPTLPKRARSYCARSGTADDSDQSDTDSEEDEVEEMIIDDGVAPRMPKVWSDRKPGRSSREEMYATRQWRWKLNKKRQEKYWHDIPMSAQSSFSMRVDSEEIRGMSPIAKKVKRKGVLSRTIRPQSVD